MANKIKVVLQKILLKTLIRLGKNDSDSFVLSYHDVAPKRIVTPQHFTYQLKYWQKNGYKFVSKVEELNKPKRILLTFDDGYASFEKYIFPILDKGKIPAIINVSTKFLGGLFQDGSSKLENQKEKIMSINSLKKIAKSKLITLGSHSHTHFISEKKSIEFIEKDILKSKSIIELITKKKCKYFTYPQGIVKKEVPRIIQKLGFRYAFTTKGRSFKNCKNILRIPRYPGEYFRNDLFLQLSRNSFCNQYFFMFYHNSPNDITSRIGKIIDDILSF